MKLHYLGETVQKDTTVSFYCTFFLEFNLTHSFDRDFLHVDIGKNMCAHVMLPSSAY